MFAYIIRFFLVLPNWEFKGLVMRKESHMKKFKNGIAVVCIMFFSAIVNAQDVNILCKATYKTMSGGERIVNYSITVSKDRSSGFLIYDGEDVYRLRLNFTHDSAYFYTPSPHASSVGDYLPYKDVMIGRQTLNLMMRYTSDDRRDFADCVMTNDKVMKVVDEVVAADALRKKKREAEDAAAKAERNKNTKF